MVHELDCVVQRADLGTFSTAKDCEIMDKLTPVLVHRLSGVCKATSPSYTTALGTSSGSLTAILCFSSVVKPAFCVVSATLSVVGTAMLGIHLPVS